MQPIRYLSLALSIFCLLGTNFALAHAEDSPPTYLEKYTDFQDAKKVSEQVNKILGSADSAEAQGGVDTGGGTIVKTSQGMGLLDLYLYNPTAFANRRMSADSVIENDASKTLGITLLTTYNQPVMIRAKEQIRKWKSQSPIISSLLIYALENMQIYYHRGTFTSVPKEFYLPSSSNIPSTHLKMVALYVSGFGVNISSADFSALPEVHQTALVIHEALRYLQDHRTLAISNQNIQKLTAMIMSRPSAGQTLDIEPYLSGIALQNYSGEQRFLSRMETIKIKICNSFNWAPTILTCGKRISNPVEIGLLMNATGKALDETPQQDAFHAQLSDAFMDQQHYFLGTLPSVYDSPIVDTPKSETQKLIDRCLNGYLDNHEQREVQKTMKAYFKGRGIEIQYSN
jgi:hypothetical protein